MNREGLVQCRYCSGTGLMKDIRTDSGHVLKILCPKCNGLGEVNWIDNITGKSSNLDCTQIGPNVIHGQDITIAYSIVEGKDD